MIENIERRPSLIGKKALFFRFAFAGAGPPGRRPGVALGFALFKSHKPKTQCHPGREMNPLPYAKHQRQRKKTKSPPPESVATNTEADRLFSASYERF
jgi:hypothetical protein